MAGAGLQSSYLIKHALGVACRHFVAVMKPRHQLTPGKGVALDHPRGR